MTSAVKTAKGEIYCDGQKHFYMEPMVALALPGEDGTMNFWTSVQVPSWTMSGLKACLGIPKHKILVNIPYVGGGFGGKLFRGVHPSCAAGVAALKTGRPVRFVLNRNQDIVMTGGRHPVHTSYEVGFDETGKISALKVEAYTDGGQGDPCNGFVNMVIGNNTEQIYGIPNYHVDVHQCTTHKTPTTAVRGPGEPQASFIIETVMEHVATEVGKSAQEVREVNIYTDLAAREKVAADPTSKDVEQFSAQMSFGKDVSGKEFHNYPALGIWEMLKKNEGYEAKAKEVADFNKAHKWRKQGLSMTPVRYAVGVRPQQAFLCVYDDGTVLITVDGSEIGQGLHTKVIQYASHHLSQIVPGCDVPKEKIRIGPNGTDKIAVGSITGGSTTSEGCCDAVRNAIEKLKEALAPAKKKLEEKGDPFTFQSLVAASQEIELQFSGICDTSKCADNYHIFGACISTVEVDILTGETTILKSSILYDCGKSLNPTIDLGQCEGGFVMGVGFFMREQVVQDTETGKVITDGSWEYKIPCAQDTPLEFNVEFFPRAFEKGISSSKGSGEPPLVLATSVFCAVRQAVDAARAEFGRTGFYRLDAPCTPRDIAMAIGASPTSMHL
eukprot:gnl/TRDRNA2_/TRDRNA2_155810_c1_seq1.p1 gnl/TRDRNA2_/TRDRNA2_155810_c1~~gnl/TRDRNA2_/TRDRNA2_155810_c1_seq1.p1  ORF type:complete len:648 (-),score=119.38 gnl/TRDRNA2_/TRDRNA2_155810_c1_seq1:125-1957(-)